MKTTLFSAAAALGLALATTAFAADVGSEAYPSSLQAPLSFTAATASTDTGSVAYPAFAGYPAAIVASVPSLDVGSVAYSRFDGQLALTPGDVSASAGSPQPRS
jgi:hypothetical protein